MHGIWGYLGDKLYGACRAVAYHASLHRAQSAVCGSDTALVYSRAEVGRTVGVDS